MGICRLDAVRQAYRTMIQLNLSSFSVARTGSTRGSVQHSLSMDQPREMSVSLNWEAGDVLGRQLLFLVGCSRSIVPCVLHIHLFTHT